MGNLSFLPQESATVTAIYEYHKKRGDSEPQRGYLGASIIGHECDRFLWFTFRNCVTKSFDGRMYRLFETGHLAEPRFVNELRSIGCEVIDHDPQLGDQIAVHGVSGHFSGHMDAVALGIPEAPKTWHVGEFKTHNDKSYTKLKSTGVKVAKPLHYAQMQVYMGLGHMDRAIYLAVNKDTDELYSERIEFNSKEFKGIMARAERIITAQQPPDRCASRQDDFRCKFCDAAALCWGTGSTALPLPCVTCRTCCHATPYIGDDEGTWSCARKQLFGRACPQHLVIPGLLTFCEPVDAGDDWIEFKNTKDGAIWRHGAAREAGQWSTEELMKTPGPLVGNAPLRASKEVLGGKVTGFEVPAVSLIDKYPPNDSHPVWEGSSDDPELEQRICDALVCDELPEPTDTLNNDDHYAAEYDGHLLLVVYKADKYAALWEGKE